ncbi:MarR family winged helix-turn-helix transcriptional regulator [Pacificibacter marinus]|uniref:MarR family winged helix-turn-helix transcriptional regulator n=1 Tax=Pacificibacter marinus TaxID=658057 RepID=UPI001C07181A|nr:MarR family winged helix-turn-helix transcriptional regulator [Pacificibacter marinus]MBU2866944.1 MarR family winged helix-turn-helix transcriptional regulator [Pacificibacter marinus]
MSQKTPPYASTQSKASGFKSDPRIQNGIPEFLKEKGFSEEVTEALLQFDVANFQWRRMWEREEFRGKVLKDLSDTLEPALLQGLISVARIQGGIGRPEPMLPTVGLVAEMMQVDPSRASRIVADIVSRGYVERGVAQDDARKAVLIVTTKGYGFLNEFMRSKWSLMVQAFEGWTEAEIETFSSLFQRYVRSIERVVQAP